MTMRRQINTLVVISAAALGVAALGAAGLALARPAVGNRAVPEPAKPVDLAAYAGLWFELGRYETGFERGCEAATAHYRPLPNGLVEVVNRCRQGGLTGKARSIAGRARVVAGSGDAKLKVSFFGPFFIGDYWVLDHADDYAWSIVGEPSGRYLWLLSRAARPAAATRAALWARAGELGYDTGRIRPTLQ